MKLEQLVDYCLSLFGFSAHAHLPEWLSVKGTAKWLSIPLALLGIVFVAVTRFLSYRRDYKLGYTGWKQLKWREEDSELIWVLFGIGMGLMAVGFLLGLYASYQSLQLTFAAAGASSNATELNTLYEGSVL